jgi:hypothetical protein
VIRRLFWALLGLGLGIVLGVRVVREIDRFSEAARPGAVAERTGRRVGTTSARVQRAVEVGRAHARSSERELRARYGVPTLEDIAGTADRAAATDDD